MLSFIENFHQFSVKKFNSLILRKHLNNLHYYQNLKKI